MSLRNAIKDDKGGFLMMCAKECEALNWHKLPIIEVKTDLNLNETKVKVEF